MNKFDTRQKRILYNVLLAIFTIGSLALIIMSMTSLGNENKWLVGLGVLINPQLIIGIWTKIIHYRQIKKEVNKIAVKKPKKLTDKEIKKIEEDKKDKESKQIRGSFGY